MDYGGCGILSKLRRLTPSGAVLAGKEAAGRLMAGLRATETPVVLAGYSRGSYATAWAMHKNFVEDCDRDVPDGACGPALGRPSMAGAHAPRNLRDLVASSQDHWELTTAPTGAQGN